MCGICGVVQISGSPRPVISPRALDRMTDSMTHRGPDDRGTYVADGIALGVRRLSIVDVDGGHQPVVNERSTVWAVQNGELFNHAELRPDLERRGHVLSSRCDTEVIPHLYEDFQDAFPTQLRGMFGIALWDGHRRRLVLARDRLGVKPMYFARVGDLLVFASELKALLASGLVAPELDLAAIGSYLTLGFFATPLTPVAGVSKLEPGTRLVVEGGAVRVERYWSYPRSSSAQTMTIDEAVERLLAGLNEAVRMRLMSDVPLGAMLSGGLDSSLIVALMAQQMSEPVKTFSVGFREDAGNELADARFVAELFGTDHHELELSFAEDSVSLDDLVWHLDEPLMDLSALGFYALCELATRDVTVALSGQGADELFGGYPVHRRAPLVAAFDRLPLARGLLGAASRLEPVSRRRDVRILRAGDAAERYLAGQGILSPGVAAELFSKTPELHLGRDRAASIVSGHASGVPGDELPLALHLSAQLGLVDDMLHYFDRASMAHSLEVRVPFLDHPFVELAAAIPSRLKVRRLSTKYVLKEAARTLLPERIVDKPKVGFFNTSMADWVRLKGENALSERLLDGDARIAELIDRAAIAKLVDDPAGRGDGSRSRLLIALLMLEIWLSSFLPRATSSHRAEVAR